jgi:hypothetical protein
MGAWGEGSFENDDAADWVYELEQMEGMEGVAAVLEKAGEGGYLESPDACIALAAAEAVAAALGEPSATLPPEVAAWAEGHRDSVDRELAVLALTVVDRIGADSELKELWEETDDFEPWKTTLTDLRQRLGGG